MLTSHWNATRFAQKPLAQPSYQFSHVPSARSDLKHSCLQYVDTRDAFHACMAEMLLLCKEATRRRRRQLLSAAPTERESSAVATSVDAASSTVAAAASEIALPPPPDAAVASVTTSKPLSLEYLADRIDVDDPIFGFLVRTAEDPELTDPGEGSPTAASETNKTWRRGMLQGFITCTTFTNYQKSFAWDSLHPAAFMYDEEHGHHGATSSSPAEEDNNSNRLRDDDGSLAAELQGTVRRGDIWNEGIVWPRIAEISLLGGLRCGRVRFLFSQGLPACDVATLGWRLENSSFFFFSFSPLTLDSCVPGDRAPRVHEGQRPLQLRLRRPAGH